MGPRGLCLCFSFFVCYLSLFAVFQAGKREGYASVVKLYAVQLHLYYLAQLVLPVAGIADQLMALFIMEGNPSA